jgi:hypothetical protein
MAFSPTSIIALTGVATGDGFTINSDQTNQISKINSNTLVSEITLLKTPRNITGANAVPGLSATLNNLPDFLGNANSIGASINTQAAGMLPGIGTAMGNKNFLSLMNPAAAWGSQTAELSAALTKYQGMTFGDLGINVKNFSGVLTTGVGATLPALQGGLNNLVQQSLLGGPNSATPLPFSANFLAKNPSGAQSTYVGEGLKSAGSSMSNFGNLFDFKNLGTTMGSQASALSMTKQLQNLGLADKYGINDKILAAGYDPKQLNEIPNDELKNILSTVQGDDLKKIQSAAGVKLVQDVSNLSQMLHVEAFIPPQARAYLGIAAAGVAGLGQLGNQLTNLGVAVDNFKMSDFLQGVENSAFQYLDQLGTLIPTPIVTLLKPFLGSGSGPFGNPTLSEMLGSVAGVNTAKLRSMSGSIASLQGTATGKAVETTARALNTAIASAYSSDGDPATDAAVAAAQSAFDVAVTAMNLQSKTNTAFATLYAAGNQASGGALAQLTSEVTNLALAGQSLYSGVANLGTGIGEFINFGSGLHSMGQDTLKMGYSKLLEGMATNNLTGDAIVATLMEGRNIARSQRVGKTTPTVPDTQAAVSSAVPTVVPNDVVWSRDDFTSMSTAYSRLGNMSKVLQDWKTQYYSGASDAEKASYAQSIDSVSARGRQLITDMQTV